MKLGLNTGVLVNRFTRPQDWCSYINTLEIDTIQLTTSLVDLSLTGEYLDYQVSNTKEWLDISEIKVFDMFTDAYSRRTNMASPDDKIRRFYIEWFKKYADVAKKLGSNSIGSHLGIVGYFELGNYEYHLDRLLDAWYEISCYCKEIGIPYMTWEPMSIKREFGHTIKDVDHIMNKIIKKNFPAPMLLCLDVDHGDISSKDKQDFDYKEYIKHFGILTPIYHIKQSLTDKGGHYPFVEPYNSKGKIQPLELIECINKYGHDDSILYLELSFREREPQDSLALEQIKQSVDYWKQFI